MHFIHFCSLHITFPCSPAFQLRRVKDASPDMLKAAMRVNRTLKPKKVKNMSADSAGEYGRLHMQHQDYATMQVRKLKGLKKRPLGDVQDAADLLADVDRSANRVSKKNKRMATHDSEGEESE